MHATSEGKQGSRCFFSADDDIINAAQYLLKQQNCNIDGFQNTLLASKLQMEPKRVPFIQIYSSLMLCTG